MEGMYQNSRCASREKDVRPKYKEAQRELRCYFSGVSQRLTEREFQQLPEHLKTYYVLELATSAKQG